MKGERERTEKRQWGETKRGCGGVVWGLGEVVGFLGRAKREHLRERERSTLCVRE